MKHKLYRPDLLIPNHFNTVKHQRTEMKKNTYSDMASIHSPLRSLPYMLTLLILASSSMSGCIMEDMEELQEEIDESTHAITYGGHDYLLVTSPKSWSAAQSHCLSVGYNLVTVNNSSEESWLNSEQLKKAPYNTKWWIGINDLGIERSWYWADGSSVSYVNWASNQPDSKYSDEDCGVDGWGSQWNDWKCGNSAYFICEKPSVSSDNSGTFVYEKSNTSNATTNTAARSIYAYAGQVVTVGTCGIAGASVSFGDTWLRIKNTTGSEISSNDDSCSSLASNISFVASSTGNYTIHAGCYGSGHCKATVAYQIGQ